MLGSQNQFSIPEPNCKVKGGRHKSLRPLDMHCNITFLVCMSWFLMAHILHTQITYLLSPIAFSNFDKLSLGKTSG